MKKTILTWAIFIGFSGILFFLWHYFIDEDLIIDTSIQWIEFLISFTFGYIIMLLITRKIYKK